MSLAGGDLTTIARVQTWLPNLTSGSNAIVAQLIGSCSALIYSKLSRARTYSQNFTRIFDGVGNYQLVLPDWPVTAISSVQIGAALIQSTPLPTPNTDIIPPKNPGFGYRFVPWAGNLPGEPAVLEFVNGFFWGGVQNIRVNYTAGYLISAESQMVPITSPFQVTVNQFQGIWCRDNGATLADGTVLTPVKAFTGTNQYIPPTDSTPGLYTFSADLANASVLISYSFIPADLEEACIQMVAERYGYRTRVGELAKSLGGQETMRYSMGGGVEGSFGYGVPPGVMMLIQPYINVIPPAIGAPV